VRDSSTDGERAFRLRSLCPRGMHGSCREPGRKEGFPQRAAGLSETSVLLRHGNALGSPPYLLVSYVRAAIRNQSPRVIDRTFTASHSPWFNTAIVNVNQQKASAGAALG